MYNHVSHNSHLRNWNTDGHPAELLRDYKIGVLPIHLKRSSSRNICQLITLATLLIVAVGCSSPSAPVEIPTRAPAPTFTPTPAGAAPQVVAPQPEAPQAEAPAQPVANENAAVEPAPAVQVEPTAIPVQEEQVVEPVATPEPVNAQVIVNTQLLNVRGGPGTNYATIGIVDQGERFNVTGKNGAGDWWEIEYNGGRGWVFNTLVATENTQNVSIAALIPVPPPPTQAPVVIVQPTPVPYVPPATATLTAAQAAYYAAVAAGQNPNPQTGQVQPQPQPQPTQPPAEPTKAPEPAKPKYEFNVAVVSKCEPQAGGTWFSGKTYKNGKPANGFNVVFSYEPDGPQVTNPMISGPHEGYNNWDPGYYSHIISANEPRAGNWYVWVTNDSGSRISELANFQTDGDSNNCNQAIVDFDSR